MTIEAVIYLPPDLSQDPKFASDCFTYMSRRGHRDFAVLRNWLDVEQAIAAGAKTVVVASAEHPFDESHDGPTVNLAGRGATAPAAQAPAQPPPATTTEPAEPTEQPRPGDRAATWKVCAALTVATAGACMVWLGLQTADLTLAVELPLYALVLAIVIAWLPFAGVGIDRAWRSDVERATKAGQEEGYKDGYEDGFVDCATLKTE